MKEFDQIDVDMKPLSTRDQIKIAAIMLPVALLWAYIILGFCGLI